MGRQDDGWIEGGIEGEGKMRAGRIFKLIERYGFLVGGDKVIAYHGSDRVIKKFNRLRTADGTFWFTEDLGKIERG